MAEGRAVTAPGPRPSESGALWWWRCQSPGRGSLGWWWPAVGPRRAVGVGVRRIFFELKLVCTVWHGEREGKKNAITKFRSHWLAT
jgi:hypothetical protein